MNKRNLPNIYGVEFLNYLKEKGCNHRSYKMYSTIDIVNSTIENKSLYLSNGYNWNDVVDRTNFNNKKLAKMNFGRCFSYSSTESVAMWMLYGGMKHRGAMIDFDKNTILEILKNTNKIDVGYFFYGEFISLKTLSIGDFEIQLIDVVYTEQKGDIITVKRSTGDKWKLVVSADSTKNILNSEQYSFVHKSKAWDYEQECRLIISVSKEMIIDLTDYDKITMVRIDLQDLNLDSARRIYSPNILEKDKSSPEFNHSHPSILINDVDWDLCYDCKENCTY